MKVLLKHFCFLSFLILLFSCTSDDSIDKNEEKPTISVNYDNGFPQGCAQLTKGETYSFRATVTDNKELASYSLDIHHNFDHHTHDDQVTECDLGDIKSPVNPFLFMENYSIEGELTSYEINISLTIPDDIDAGDYHCAYSVTDETGWQSRTSIDIKIVE
ncbi:DUF4625 domain-containing protein [Arenibacter sp. F20364]|uniref:DUF4625 domain-containing protein n=1 Tax=Arenibacter sp. F20364 TaxID=2926415 RepID=UPI001FF67313|nr:DUF4625 domain-containing protein [Arenibacter sp. F20364]MCK0192063.1 DUF4625 domain-containing protein [Arenibacter sp. F20364]